MNTNQLDEGSNPSEDSTQLTVLNGELLWVWIDTLGLPFSLIADKLIENNCVIHLGTFVQAAINSGNYKTETLPNLFRKLGDQLEPEQIKLKLWAQEEPKEEE